jgi:hypothetical protein
MSQTHFRFNFLGALAYAEISSHLASQTAWCSQANLEFLAFAARRHEVTQIGDKYVGQQEYYTLTYGLAGAQLELLSQQFEGADICLSNIKLSEHQTLNFNC